MSRPGIVCVLGVWLTLPASAALTVRVVNPTGDVKATVARVRKVEARTSSPARKLLPGDTSITREKDLLIVQCQPADGAKIDIELELPYGVGLEAKTEAGTISVTGLIPYAALATSTGNIELTAPWAATRLVIQSEKEPRELSIPKELKFSHSIANAGDGRMEWRLSDKLPDLKITYGDIQVNAVSPGRISLTDIDIPEDSPIKLPWQAPAILDAILAGAPGRGKGKAIAPSAGRSVEASAGTAGAPVFRSDVRMVNLQAAVFDSAGHAVPGLKPEDFEVLEDGVRQKVALAGAEEVPFNLVLLLDLSGSTKRDRPAMKEAARRFIAIARPQDRVAIYALAYDLLQVVSPLGTEREKLLAAIDAIPDVAGGTPLYDSIALSYAEELLQRPEERNAMIVISDGLDNQIQGEATPSKVSFHKLRQAAALMNVLIYPIFLTPFTLVPPPPWSLKAETNLALLSKATGGRLFRARSLQDLEPVYPLVAEEMRSVYSIAYYPSNQNFDGRWRQMTLRTSHPGIQVRTRQGYIAR